MNIYEKMSAITNELNRVAKNLAVGTGKSSYKAAGEADILAEVKPAEEKYGVYSYPVGREIIETAVLTSSKVYNGETYETKQQMMRLKVVYRFVNIEAPEEYIDIISYGDGVDPQDKAPGKAMTYADKYALMKAYKIITGEDPDQKESALLTDKKSPMASDKQKAFIQKLYERSPENAAYIEKAAPGGPDSLTMAEATAIIGALK